MRVAAIAEDVAALRLDVAKAVVATPAPAANDVAPASSGYGALEDLFRRILDKNMAIYPPVEGTPFHHIPGISRPDLQLLLRPPHRDDNQRRLAELAVVQAERMEAAADKVATIGIAGLQRLSATDADARLTLAHAEAYASHPVYLARLGLYPAAVTPPSPVASLLRRLKEGLRGSRPATAFDSDERPAPSNPTSAESLRTIPAKVSDIHDVRAEAIRDLADAILSDHRMRVEAVDGRLTVVAIGSDGEWDRSIAAFGDEPTVRDAIEVRHQSPWLDVSAKDRDETLRSIRERLLEAKTRPLEREGKRWHVQLEDPNLQDKVERWAGYDRLHEMLSRVDANWHTREDRLPPTSLSDQVLGRFADRAVAARRVAEREGARPIGDLEKNRGGYSR